MDIPLEPPPPYPFKSLPNFKSFKSLLNTAKVAWTVAGVLLGMLMIAVGACLVYSHGQKLQPPIYKNRHIVPKSEPILIGGTRYVYDVTAVDLNGHRVNRTVMTSEEEPEIMDELVKLAKKGLEDDLKRKAEIENYKQSMAERTEQIQEEEEKSKKAQVLNPWEEDWSDYHDIPTRRHPEGKDEEPEDSEESEESDAEDSDSSVDEPESVKIQDALTAKDGESVQAQNMFPGDPIVIVPPAESNPVETVKPSTTES